MRFDTAHTYQDEQIDIARRALNLRVKQYTKDVEAYVRTTNKRGFKHKPRTAVKVRLLVAGKLYTLNTTMRGVYDIMRSQV